MAELTNKNIEFLSDRELVIILRSILEEIDLVATIGAHRSTTYLAVSTIEGLLGDLIKLLNIQPQDVLTVWPKKKAKFKKLAELHLKERVDILKTTGDLPPAFENLYHLLREFRNYMHPEKELREQTPIAQSIGQLALASLNALIEMYEPLRFIVGQKWELIHGEAQVPESNLIHMPQKPGDHVSLLVSEFPAQHLKEITFQVLKPADSIFNFVYNYSSKDGFMAARIEGRPGHNGMGLDNGRLVCTTWRTWTITDRYVTEPNPESRQHSVRVVLDTPGNFDIVVDGQSLELTGGVSWGFGPQDRIGFMTEWGHVSIVDISLQTK